MVSDIKKTPPGSVCRLRPLRAEDRATCLIWRNDPELRGQMMGHRFPVTDEMEMHWLSRAMDDADRSLVAFAIEDISDGAFVGIIQLKQIDWTSRTAYLGIFVGDPQRQDRGIGAEALGMLLRFAFSDLNLRKVLLEVADFNESAIRLYLRYGFVEEGRLRQQYYLDGSYHDVLIMSVFQTEASGA